MQNYCLHITTCILCVKHLRFNSMHILFSILRSLCMAVYFGLNGMNKEWQLNRQTEMGKATFFFLKQTKQNICSEKPQINKIILVVYMDFHYEITSLSLPFGLCCSPQQPLRIALDDFCQQSPGTWKIFELEDVTLSRMFGLCCSPQQPLRTAVDDLCQ